MRITLGVLFLFIVVFALSTDIARAGEMNIENYIEPRNVSLESGFIVYSDEDLDEMRYESRMDLWKEKQSALWSTLPTSPFTINASAYTASADECGNTLGITASGIKVEVNRTLACPPNYPFGTKIEIDGMGTYTCEDRGGAIKGNHFDIYMQTKTEAFAFGRRNLTARVVFN